MKKFFAIAVIAIAFVACNNDGDKTETTTDSTAVEVPVVDPTTVPAVVDSAAAVVDSTVAPATN